MLRFKFVQTAVVTAVAAATLVGVGVIQSAGAVGAGTISSFVPIVPCRLIDTRTDTTVGTRSTPLQPGETATFAVWGTNGNCTIPNTATGIVANATAVNPTSSSFVTIFPSDATQPTTSNLNVVAASPPTPNQVTVALSAAGKLSAFNQKGTLDFVLDIVGYYQAAATTPTTPTPVPVTQYFSGSDTVFQNSNSAGGVVYNSNNCVTFTSFFQGAFMPLELPIGAKVTGVQIRYVDKSGGAVNVTLHNGEPGLTDTIVGTTLQTIGTNGTDFHRSDDFNLGATPAAVSSQSTYWLTMLSAVGTGGGANVDFCGALVTYTL
ncbi:MAG: hypothetical protein JWN62_106 [Acidimicrobiales bacterium]|nr:hypothetical protein [Acidimicrobiales bacterium]